MKKVWLVLLVVVLAVAAGLVAFWPQVRLWQMQQALDRVLIPALKAQYMGAYGREPVVSYQGLTAEGSAFLAKDFNLSLSGQPEYDIRIKSLRLDKVDLSLWGELKSCDLAMAEVVLGLKGLQVGNQNLEVQATVASVDLEGLSVTDGGQHIRVARQDVKDFQLVKPSLKKSVKIAEMEALAYDVTFGPQWKTSQGSLGKLSIKVNDDIVMGWEGLSFSLENPSWQNGMGYFDNCTLKAQGLAANLKHLASEPVLALAEVNMTMSRKPQRAADRLELKGLTWRELDQETEASKTLKELGYPNPRLDLTYDYVYDQAAKTFDCKEASLGLQQGGTLTCGFLLKNVDIDLTGNSERNLEAIKKARPLRLHLRYDDASLAEKLLALGAKKQGVSPEAFRTQLLQDSGLRLPGAMGPEPALLAFIAKPERLCLTITPRQELSFADYTKLGPVILALLDYKLDNCAK